MTSNENAEAVDAGNEVSAAVPVSAEVAFAAQNIIKNHVMMAGTASIVPVPLFDIAAIAGVQVRMIKKLAELHGKTFAEAAVRNTITALCGGVLGHGAGITAAVSLTKLVPGFGWMLGAVSMPVVAGSTTYAIGQVFERHFENGGSIYDISVESMREYFNEQLKRGKKVAAEAKNKIVPGNAESKSAA
jgi:uncharacterized protein (DUF697 family)